MPDYSLGKIYMIEPIVEHDEGDIYILRVWMTN
jgi:hypothetical protein